MPTGTKHLIRCRCVLSQFKNLPNPPPHHFVVFSIVNDDGTVVQKFAQCNNCGIVHKVTDICTSEIVAKEAMSSIITIDDVRPSIPQNLAIVLDKNNVDVATWECVRFIIENKQWGSFVVLNSEVESGVRQGKYVQILSESMFKVDSFSREEYVR